MLSSNIYIYNNVQNKYKEMNTYIKNKLECTTEEFTIPSKYKFDYLYDYLPKTEDRLKDYTKFYDIDIYDKERNIKIQFRAWQ